MLRVNFCGVSAGSFGFYTRFCGFAFCVLHLVGWEFCFLVVCGGVEDISFLLCWDVV